MNDNTPTQTPTEKEIRLEQLEREKSQAEHDLANAEAVVGMRRYVLDHILNSIANCRESN